MSVTLSGDGLSVPLLNTQEDVVDVEASVIDVSMFSTSPGETFLLPISASDEGSPSGRATGNRLSSMGYSGDSVTALAQWVADLESLADGAMGSTLTLESTTRNRSINGQLRSITWDRETGAPYDVNWSIEFVRGRTLDLSFGGGGGGSGPESVSPSSSASLAGYDLGELLSYRVSREQDLTEIEIPQFLGDIDVDDNFVFSSGGVVRTFSIEGRKVGSDSALSSFENAMASRQADLLNTVSYNEAFPGRSLDVAIQNYRGTRAAGDERILEYSLDLIEGTQIGDLDIFQELTN